MAAIQELERGWFVTGEDDTYDDVRGHSSVYDIIAFASLRTAFDCGDGGVS